MHTKTLDALVGLYLSSATRGPKAPRPFRLDSDGVTISLEVPGPGVLAEVPGLLQVPDGTLYRTGTSGVVDEDGAPVDLREVATALVDALAALPDRSDAGEPYRALQRLAGSDFAAEYARDVVKVWRRNLEKEPKPEPVKKPRPRRERTPDVERKRASREQQRADEEESVRWFLAGWLAGRFTTGPYAGSPLPAGTRVPAPRLRRKAEKEIGGVVEEFEAMVDPVLIEPTRDDYPDDEEFEQALDDHSFRLERLASEPRADRLAEWEEWADEDVLPLRPRVPRRSVFFSLADEVLGERTRTRDGQVYTVPDKTKEADVPKTKNDDAFAEAVLDRVAALAWEEKREALSEYLERAIEERDSREQDRDSGGRFAPAADGTVVPLFG